jgi:hypothetical protein
MWQAIHVAADALLADDLPLATAILEASQIVSATGSLELCYDERGNRYKVPQYCYAHPMELRMADPTSSVTKTVGSSSSSTIEHNSVPINIKIRLNPGDKNYTIKVMTGELVSDLKRCIAEQSCPKPAEGELDPQPSSAWVHPPHRQRIMFLGRELKDPQRICDLQLDERKVVQVFLRPLPAVKA